MPLTELVYCVTVASAMGGCGLDQCGLGCYQGNEHTGDQQSTQRLRVTEAALISDVFWSIIEPSGGRQKRYLTVHIITGSDLPLHWLAFMFKKMVRNPWVPCNAGNLWTN